MSYSPPTGASLSFRFLVSYSPPVAKGLVFEPLREGTGTIAPGGIVGAGSGTAYVISYRAGVDVLPYGTDSSSFGTARAALGRFVYPVGADVSGAGGLYDVVLGYYSPAYSGNLALHFGSGYLPAVGNVLPFDFLNTHSFHQIVPVPIAAEGYGTTTVANVDSSVSVAPTGIAPNTAGTPSVLIARYVQPVGIAAGAYGAAQAQLMRQYVLPTGFTQTSWTAANSGTILNWRQPVTLAGLAPIGVGTAKVVNTTATQLVSPTGFNWSAYGALTVSPRYVFPAMFSSLGLGTPNVQLPPHPLGIDSAAYGYPTVKDNHQDVLPAGLASSALGQPNVQVMRAYVYAPTLTESTLFGDTHTILHQRYVAVPATNDGFISPFASVDNRNRQVLPFPIPTTAFGTAAPHNKSPNVTPAGFDSSVFGAQGVGAYYRTVYPTGFYGPPAGTPAVKNAAATIAPAGLASLAMTGPVATFRIRTLKHAGSDDTSYGVPTVWPRVRTLVNISGGDTSLFGTASADLSNRKVLGAQVAATAAFGSATTWFASRALAPAGIAFDFGKQFGPTGVAFSTRRLPIVGFTEETFGATSARRNEVVVSPTGFTGDVGMPFPDLAKRYLLARGWVSEEKFGELTQVYNARQYVVPFWSPDSVVLLGAVGKPWDVENGNRIVSTFGFDMSTVARAGIVENAGRDIHPGAGDQLAFGVPMVAPRVRYVGAEGFDAFFARYSTVANASSVLYPSGIPHEYAGVPHILDTRQWLDAVGGRDGSALGVPFTAFAIRTVNIGQSGIRDPYVPVPTADLYTRYVAPKTFESGQGVPTVEGHRNVIAIYGNDMSRYGQGFVKNVTPEVAVFATLLTEYGKPVVYNRNSYVAPSGFDATYGKPLADYRLKTVLPGGFQSLKMTSLNNVHFDAPDLPAQQTIVAQWSPQDMGVVNAPTPPTVQLRGMICTGFMTGTFGMATLTSNVIGPVFILTDESAQCGVPSLNGPQTVTVPSIEYKQAETFYLGAPASTNWMGTVRITPTTVAIDVAADPKRVVDFDYTWGDIRPKWGTASVVLQNRRVTQSTPDYTPTIFGVPDTSLGRRTISMTGIRSFRYGVPAIPGLSGIAPYWGRTTPEEIPGVNIDPAGYGAASVARPVDKNRSLGMSGLSPVGSGTPVVQLFNRVITGAGAIYGTLLGYGNVHPPVRIYPTGFVNQAIGKLATGLKYRTVFVDSSYMDSSWGVDYQADGYGRPLTVRHKNTTLAAKGFAAGAIGTAYTGLLQRPVGVAAIAPAGAGSARVTSRNEIDVAGFDSAVMGTPKQPVFGTVEPAGDDMACFGVGMIGRVIHAPYIEPGLAGAPRIKSGIRVLGMETEFGETVVIGESNCASTLAVAARLGDLTTFGLHGVHR